MTLMCLWFHTRTRFTSRAMLVQKLERYDSLFKVASARHTDAVFLTLTTDPSRFSNLYEANRQFSHSFNRFMSRLRGYFARRGQHLEYIAVYEFTKSGLLHAHVIIFGVRYLLPVRVISRWWSEAGQGRVVYIYRLRNVDGRWVWARRRPRDVRAGEGAEDYLKKYLRKALRLASTLDTSDVKKVLPLALYWAFNKRFFTYSRSLLPSSRRTAEAVVSEYLWVGTYRLEDLPDWVFWLPHRVYSPPSRGPPPT
uniref:RepTP2 n=1 Tax=Thermococcus prieurii TaxID=1128108 RepID=R4LBR1_9EURY|nr:RepTP2 [Thermococcus prieurii]AVP12428.1 RepTP2 [E. coli-T. kodakarensis shuttle vector pTPTK1]AVP12434.1 RepTP2 [E. coli-T. kodakarensis shuttle vector pTPTK2]AVP12439.1 RepTP2 [E. coli-T. kodakarensis shuttle vector pTPTK3]